MNACVRTIEQVLSVACHWLCQCLHLGKKNTGTASGTLSVSVRHIQSSWLLSSRATSLAVVAFTLLLPSSAPADDWPQWGGPQRDIVWRESGIAAELPAGDLPRVWSQPIGAGYTGPAVADGRVFVADRLAEERLERVLAFSAETGEPLWTHAYETDYAISYPLGPRATPTVDENRVYCLGAVGHLKCLDVEKGEVIWKKHLPQDFGTKLPTWGIAAAPLIEGNQLIVLAGGAEGALVVSFDKLTGDELWRSLENRDVGYCSPVILEFGGQRQLIIWHPAGINGLDPASGEVLWELPHSVRVGMSIATPRKQGNRLFVSSFYDGALMVDLGDDGRSPEVLWRTSASSNEVKNDTLHAIMCAPIFTEDAIYGINSYGALRCLDPASGEIVWETFEATGKGRWWNAFMIPHVNGTYICNEQGELILAELSRSGYKELARSKLIEPTERVRRRMTVWSHPAFAMKSIFARNDKEIIRVSLADSE